MRNLSAQKHSRPFNQDGDSRQDNKHECLKGTTEGPKLMLMLAAITMQMQCECIKGALALGLGADFECMRRQMNGAEMCWMF